MAGKLYNSFADIPALEAQLKQVQGIYKQVEDGITHLSSLGFKIESSKGMAELAAATANLTKAEKDLAAANAKLKETEDRLAAARTALTESSKKSAQSAKEQVDSYKALSDEMSVNIQRQIELKARLNEVNASIKKLSEFADAAKGSKQFTDELVKLTEEQTRLKVELQSTTKFINNQAKEFVAQEGSLEQLRAKLAQMTQAYDAMGDATKATDFGKSAKSSIVALTTEIKNLEEGTLRFQRNVGNYPKSAQILVDAFEKSKQEVAKFTNELGQVAPEGEHARKEMEALRTIVDNEQFLNVAAKIGDANAQTKFFTKSLQSLEQQGLKNTQVYRDTEKELAHLTDLVADTRQEIKALSSDTRGFDLFAGAVSTVASGFQLAASSAELFAGSNENIQKSIQKLVAIQNISNGLRQIANDFTTRGSAANKLYAYTEGLIKVAMDATASATLRLNAALKTVGIGLLIAGISYVITKLLEWSNASDDTDKALEELNKTIERQNELLTYNASTIDRQTQKRIQDLKQAGATELQIRVATIQGLYKDAALRKAAGEKIVGDQKYAYGLLVDNEKAAFQAMVEAQSRGDKEGEATFKSAYEHFKAYEEDLRKVRELNTDSVVEGNKKRADAEKKAADDNKKYTEEERKNLHELITLRLEQAASQQEAFKNLEGAGQGRIQNALNELEIRKKILQEEMTFELNSEDAKGAKRTLIAENYSKKLSDLEVKTAQDIVQIRRQEKQSLLDEAESTYQAQVDADAKAVQDRIANATKWFESFQLQAEKQAAEEKQLAAKKYKDGTISEEEYTKELEKIEYDYQTRSLQNTIDFYQEQVNILKIAGKDTLALETALANARAALATRKPVDDKDQNAIKEQQKSLLAELSDGYKALGAQIQQTFADVISGIFDKQKNELQEQIDKIEELKAAEISRTDQLPISEEKKAAKIKVIEAKAQADRERIQRRQRELDRQKAIFERAFKGFQITTDTIQEVSKIKLEVLAAPLPLKPLIAAQIPIAIATGAAALVSLLATPIPKYFTGTESSKAGLAVVGDRGPELGVDPSGKLHYWATPTLTNLSGGTRIYNAEATDRIMAAAEHERTGLLNMFNKKTSSTDPTNEEIVEELKKLNKKPTRITIINDKSIETTAWWDYQMKH